MYLLIYCIFRLCNRLVGVPPPQHNSTRKSLGTINIHQPTPPGGPSSNLSHQYPRGWVEVCEAQALLNILTGDVTRKPSLADLAVQVSAAEGWTHSKIAESQQDIKTSNIASIQPSICHFGHFHHLLQHVSLHRFPAPALPALPALHQHSRCTQGCAHGQ